MGFLVPLLAIGTLIAIAAGGKKKKATGDQPPAMSDIEGAGAQMATLYSRLMDPSKTNLVELEQGANLLQANGHPDWAGNVYSKISSLKAQQSAAAQGQGAAQAAAVEAQEAAKKAGAAKAEAAKQSWEQAAGGRPDDATLTATYQAAMSPGMTDVGQMQYAVAVLRAYGHENEAAQIEARIVKLQNENKADLGTEVATKAPTGQPVVLNDRPASIEPGDEDSGGAEEEDASEAEPTELTKAETAPEADPIGTIRLARNLKAAEETSNWKTALQPDVQSWQSRAGLTADGKFGPKSALRMGEEVGILPRVRYWSNSGGTKEQQVSRYRSDLNALADRIEAKGPEYRLHAAGLRVSAAQEDGRGFPSRPAKDPNATANAKLAADAVAATEGEPSELAKMKELLKLGPEGLKEYYEQRQAAKSTLGIGA